MSASHFDVFLSYNRADVAFVREAAARLQRDGIKFWMDEVNIGAGEFWQKSIQSDLPRCDSCAVFIGPSGFGPWQELEMYAALSQQVEANRGFRLIPVLLPGATQDKTKDIPPFLRLLTWVKFKDTPDRDDAAWGMLLDGIRGERRGFVPAPPKYLATSASQQKIRPRGLRSFEADDHEWFLRLVPGPRDERGLPSALRFWKDRLERIDPDDTFRVGLLYGPSGCGKSSLVKAGLIPALANFVLPIYVEATTENTEATILRKLRKALPGLPADQTLSQTLAALREHPALAGGRKVVLLLDQFEQWLHAHSADTAGELPDALRHCDGGRLQAILMVRDEFFLSVNRFLEALDVRISEGVNFAKADLFDLDHARAALLEYGRAFGRLPDAPGGPDAEQEKFLAQVLDSLQTDGGRIVCVHLALLAEMHKDRPWTPAALAERGGAKGLGLHFLKETFDGRSANPAHKTRRGLVMAVLKELLPEAGANIRGRSRSTRALAQAAALPAGSTEFENLLKILNEELRLITPTEASGESSSPDASVAGFRYQLTHDYLVPSLREWLTQTQRETARGRAALCLKERTAQWNTARALRFLPGPTEYLRILCLTPRANRAADQKDLMSAAGRFYTAALAVVALLAFAGFTLWDRFEQARARAKVEILLMAPPAAVPIALANLVEFRCRASRILRAEFDLAATNSQIKLRTALGLAELGEVQVPFFLDGADWVPTHEWPSVTRALAGVRDSVLAGVPQRMATVHFPEARARLATLSLHRGDAAPAQRLTMRASNPADRTAFIHNYHEELSDSVRLVHVLQSIGNDADQTDFRSALCAAGAVMKLDAMTHLDQTTLVETMRRLHMNAPDGGTHSAAACALTRWGQPLPEIPGQTNLPAPGRDWFVNRMGMTMLRIRDGTFQMGDRRDTDTRTHPVTLTTSFFISDREVTVALFRQFANLSANNASTPTAERLTDWTGEKAAGSPETNCPVQQVSWFDAVKFSNWLSRQEGRLTCYHANTVTDWDCDLRAEGYRLPTEAEWEYACRALCTNRFTFGENDKVLGEYAWYAGNSGDRARPASSKLPNLWGLFDMHGNLWEWCQDWYVRDYYSQSPETDPPGPKNGESRVFRGGSWIIGGPAVLSCSYRASGRPSDRGDGVGFRCVLVVVGSASR